MYVGKAKTVWIAIILMLGLLVNLTGCDVPATPSIPAEAPTPEAAPNEAVVLNAGFEEVDADGKLTGWSSSGDETAILVEERGHSGNLRLTHKESSTYIVETSQSISGLSETAYTLSAWVRSSGENEVYMALVCADQEKRVYVPATTPGYRWIRLSVSLHAAGGSCLIKLHSFGTPESWASFDDIELTPGETTLSMLGADISSLHKSENLGGIYKYSDGTQADALEILKASGMNYARLRIWVNPADGYHNKEEILLMAKRIKSLGLKLLVDFHYSDDWADPGKQNKPAAWKNLDFEQLKQAVYDHTYDVCKSLADQGTPADMVQIGNEINAGMLWPDGDYNHFDKLGALLKSGYQAVKDGSDSTLIMLHIAEGGDNEMARWWFDNITRQEVPFDVIGISYYPFWHGTLAELQANLSDLSARYDKDVVVAEFAYPFTVLDGDKLANIVNRNMVIEGYPFTPEGQRRMMRDVMSVVRGVPGGRGLGVFYWDATWTVVPGNGWDTQDPNSGNSWDNQALFDFNGEVLPALSEYLNP